MKTVIIDGICREVDCVVNEYEETNVEGYILYIPSGNFSVSILIVGARNEEEALNIYADSDECERTLLDEDLCGYNEDDVTYLGNASEPHYRRDCHLERVNKIEFLDYSNIYEELYKQLFE